MRDEVFVNYIIKTVDPNCNLSKEEVIKRVEEKFTSDNSAMAKICPYYKKSDMVH